MWAMGFSVINSSVKKLRYEYVAMIGSQICRLIDRRADDCLLYLIRMRSPLVGRVTPCAPELNCWRRFGTKSPPKM
jgi:hypothetical protein